MKSSVLIILLFFNALAALAQNDSLSRVSDSTSNADSILHRKDSITQSNLALVASLPRDNNSQQEVYRIKKSVDIPLTIAGDGWSLYAFTVIYNKDTSSVKQILSLNKNDISPINRWAVDEYSEKAFEASNVFFYAAMPLPLVLLFDKPIRKDAFKIGLLYLEAMGITGILYTGSAYIHDKYRPYAYNPEAPMIRRQRGGAKNSFFAGHVALVGTSTFFVSKVYADYHPDSKIKWLFYSMAGVATLTTGYLRHLAGEHFPTDIAIGVGVGTLTGLFVPHFHKNPLIKNPNLSIRPIIGDAYGFSISYRF